MRSASCVALFRATPLRAGWVQGAKFVPDCARALENKPVTSLNQRSVKIAFIFEVKIYTFSKRWRHQVRYTCSTTTLAHDSNTIHQFGNTCFQLIHLSMTPRLDSYLSGSPPNFWIFSRTHLRANTWSLKPKFPLQCSSSVLKNPSVPKRKLGTTNIMSSSRKWSGPTKILLPERHTKPPPWNTTRTERFAFGLSNWNWMKS